MARKKTPADKVEARIRIGQRIREIRRAVYGGNGNYCLGLEELTGRLGVGPSTWNHYEAGVQMPGDVMLKFLCETGASPQWLLGGLGPMFDR
jgi:transcriptional regulator with XRE-family HTH domain